MPQLKCPQCAREVPAGTTACPWDGTPINSVIVRDSMWNAAEDKTQLRPPSGDTDELPALLPGQKLGDYEVRSVLGSGGMGEVYAGEQPMIGKKVAIKVLKAEVAADPANVQRMLSEARAVNAIRHRGIVDIFNFGNLPDGRPYLVMEYLEGIALDQMLRKQGALIAPEACEFLEEICSALAAAHQRNIVHRDLKPANVYIVSDVSNPRNRYVKLLDFGLAKGAPSQDAQKQTRAGMVVGTPDYIAPEQARGGTITPRTDLYSLGVMAFEMLTGALPFTAESVVELMMKHVQEAPPRVSTRIDFCPPALDALVYALMQKEPGDRPRSAEQVRVEIARIRRELREGETQTGSMAPTQTLSLKETIKIPTPPETPEAVVQLPPPRARVSRAPAVPKKAEVDPTSRYAAVPFDHPGPAAKKKGGGAIIAGAVALLLAVAAGVWFFVLQPDAPGPVMVPPPPVIAETTPEAPDAVKPPDPAPTTEAAVVKAPKPPPKSGPKAAAGDKLQAEFDQQLTLMRGRYEFEKWSPGVIAQVVKMQTDKFSSAKTPAEKKNVIAEVRSLPAP